MPGDGSRRAAFITSLESKDYRTIEQTSKLGKKEVTEIIIEAAPVAVNLLGELIQWVGILALQDSKGGPKTLKAATRDSQTFTELSSDRSSKVRDHFQQQFSYAYNGGFSDPPQQSKDDLKLATSEDSFNAQSNNTGGIGVGVGSAIQGTVATWAQRDLINDITSRITVLVQAPSTNAFEQTAFTLTYPDTQGGSGKTFQTDIAWVYCSVQAPDPNDHTSMVNTLFVYAIGVGYLADSWGTRIGSRVMGTAIAAFVYAAKDRPANINVVVKSGATSGTITISTQNPPKVDRKTGDPVSPYAWALDLLQQVGIAGSTVAFGTANAEEAAEIGYLTQWEAS